MRIPVKRLDLTSVGYDGYWVDAPRSVKEGWIADLQKSTNGVDLRQNPDVARRQNLRVFDLITAWNLDGDNGDVLPLVKDLDDPDEKLAVMGEVPIEIVVHIVQEVIGGGIPEATRDFSSGS